MPEGAQVRCRALAECPEGLACRDGLCLPPSSDALAPDLSEPARVSPTVGREKTRFEITLQASEPLLEPPVVTLALAPPVVLPCEEGASSTWRCGYTATGVEFEGADGAASFDVALVDLAHNRATRRAAGTLHFDFHAPQVAAAARVYLPAADNPLGVVSAARADTQVELTLWADEPLAPAFVPTLVAVSDAGAFDFGEPAERGESSAVFRAAPGSAPDGTYGLALAWRDPAGNAAELSLSEPAVVVASAIPSLVVDQAAVTFVRSPWGSSAKEAWGSFQAPAGPYFALAPADPLTGPTVLPAGAFTFRSGAAPVEVRVWADPAATFLLGSLRPNAQGAWPRQKLQAVDVPGVYVTGLDVAGNASRPVALEHAEWIATPHRPTSSANPFRLESTPFAERTLHQSPLHTRVETSGGEGRDGKTISVAGEGAWRPWRSSSDVPPHRHSAGLAYDTARGRLVLFGGLFANRVTLGDTWEFDGLVWKERTAPDLNPPARWEVAMAYDSRRARTVLFGGDGFDDTWEWDGESWAEQTPASKPPSRSAHGMVYDTLRAQVVVFGGRVPGTYNGRGDLWTWDGAGWTERLPAAGEAWPPARWGHAMAFDEKRGVAVVYGGSGACGAWCRDVWEWDGSAWAEKTPAAGPPAPSDRKLTVMAYDRGREKVLMFGTYPGFTGGDRDLWEWDGAAWTDRTPPGERPAARWAACAAYDGARGRVFVFGGCYGGNGADCAMDDAWEWDGTGWIQRVAGKPSARANHRFAYDERRRRLVTFGGGTGGGAQFDDTWEWNGASFLLRQPAAAAPKQSWYAFAYDPAAGAVRMWDGGDVLWSYDGAGWTSIAAAAPVPARRRPSFAMAGAALVAFGAEATSDGHKLADTWQWSGGAGWSQVGAGTSAPPARSFDGMASDGAAAYVFGGSVGPASFTSDLWKFSSADGWKKLADAGAGPSARAAPLTWNPDRKTLLVYGGFVDGRYDYPADLWEFDGVAWRDRTPTRFVPRGHGDHAAAYDPVSKMLVSLGGYAPAGDGGNTLTDDVWLWDDPASRQPAVQFTGNLPADVPAERVEKLRVRASCAGAHAGGGGAHLLAWSARGEANEPGGWRELEANDLADPAAGPPLLHVADAAQAGDLVSARDGRFAFQCRPSGLSSPQQEARVSLDAVEVRVRYRTRP